MTPEQVFLQHRPLLLGISYRILGMYAEAEDVVQDAYIRFSQANDVRDARAFLATIVTRASIDRLRSAKHKREEYIGPWLPEPMADNSISDPALLAEQQESVSMAFLLLLEQLDPVDRAVIVLRDIFDFDYAEIARFIDKSEEASRQIASRARKLVRRPIEEPVLPDAHKQKLLDAFMKACSRGNLESLMSLLAQDIQVYTDSGGRVRAAARNVVFGQDNCARFFLGILKKYPPGSVAVKRSINGQPGIAVFVHGKLYAGVSFAFGTDGKIHSVYSTLNPEKHSGLRKLKKPGLLYRIVARIYTGMLG
ncbi:MAG: RNA polymerase sigma factor SigJ [Leptospirales bacterium]|nr:RNA polymerase sigma factor SigJ [Leptospirales bacterium]